VLLGKPNPVGDLAHRQVARLQQVSKAWVDGGYRQHLVEHAASLDIDVENTQRKPGTSTRGFTPIPNRWVVERTGDLGRRQDRARLPHPHHDRDPAAGHDGPPRRGPGPAAESNEIPAFQPLPDATDLTGSVLTGDALGTQHGHGAYLRKRGAHCPAIV
jgi:hypothetical protein